MKLKYQFEIVDMGDEYIAVPVGEDAEHLHGVLKLNDSGREIVAMLRSQNSVGDIVNRLTAKYDNDADSIEAYVRGFVEYLRSHDLICD